MKYIVFDLEATCWEYDNPGLVQETIEIGAVKVNRYGEIEDTFSRFIQPIIHPYLSPFCLKLTNIDQSIINGAEKFNRVVEDFQNWIDIYDGEYQLCSWGKFDKTQLIQDSELHRLEHDWLAPHVNMKKQYARIKGFNKPIGLRAAVKRERFEFTGTPHRAIADAENTCKIFQRYIEEWE